jgi:hypothetical protein
MDGPMNETAFAQPLTAAIAPVKPTVLFERGCCMFFP